MPTMLMRWQVAVARCTLVRSTTEVSKPGMVNFQDHFANKTISKLPQAMVLLKNPLAVVLLAPFGPSMQLLGLRDQPSLLRAASRPERQPRMGLLGKSQKHSELGAGFSAQVIRHRNANAPRRALAGRHTLRRASLNRNKANPRSQARRTMTSREACKTTLCDLLCVERGPRK